MPFEKPLSPVERLWVVADAICPPFVNQLVLEGAGRIDDAALTDAAARAGDAHPGARLVLRGRLEGSRWVDGGVAVPVRRVDGSAWDGSGPEGAPFLQGRLPPRTGPTCEVVAVDGDPWRLVIRTHHAVMDGRGTLALVEDLFRALRGEPLEGTDSAVTDLELARRLRPPRAEKRGEDCLAPTGPARGDDTRITWRRRFVPGRFSALLPRIALAVARLCRRQGAGRVRLDVPVDLRGAFPDVRSSGNLTGMVFLDLPEDATVDGVADGIRRRVLRGEAGSFVVAAAPLSGVPLWLMRAVGAGAAKRVHTRGRYVTSGAISNLGRMPFERFSGGGFRCAQGFFIPPGSDSHPFFLGMSGRADGVELVLSMPLLLASDGRLEEALDALAGALLHGAMDSRAESSPRISA